MSNILWWAFLHRPSWLSLLDRLFSILSTVFLPVINCDYLSGPALSGSLVKTFGFGAMLTGCGIVCFLYCPLLLLLRYFFLVDATFHLFVWKCMMNGALEYHVPLPFIQWKIGCISFFFPGCKVTFWFKILAPCCNKHILELILYFLDKSYLKPIFPNRDPPGKTQQEKDEDLVSDISTLDMIRTWIATSCDILPKDWVIFPFGFPYDQNLNYSILPKRLRMG